MIDHKNKLSVRKQSEILGIKRNRIYYEKTPIKAQDVDIMNEMIEINQMY